MKKPDFKEARRRDENKVSVIRDFKIKDNMKNIGLNKKYLVKTYGCQMNERDSENISAILECMGYTRTNTIDDANLITPTEFIFCHTFAITVVFILIIDKDAAIPITTALKTPIAANAFHKSLVSILDNA